MTDRVVILAGGKGTRLNPLTQARPKPSVYIGGNKRFGEYPMDMALKAGYVDFYMVVEHMGHEIEKNFHDGTNFRYEVEKQPVPIRIRYVKAPRGKKSEGTADALRIARPYLADSIIARDKTIGSGAAVDLDTLNRDRQKYDKLTYVENYDAVVVLSADHVSGLDLSELVRFHKARGSFATLGIIEASPERIAGNLGEVGYDVETGLVTYFGEKPRTAAEVKHRTGSTGIYVLDRAMMKWLDEHPKLLDFANEVFPALLNDPVLKNSVNAHVLHGYWNDVGTLNEYLTTSMQLIDGIDGVDVRSHRVRVQENSRVLGKMSRNLIGQGCYVGPNVEVTGSILCNDIQIQGSDSKHPTSIDSSVLFHNVVIGSGVDLVGVISDSDVTIESGASIGKGAVIGKGTTIRSGARIGKGVIIGMGNVITGKVNEGEVVD
ncbi:MAG TPA: NDP-sugar synthase [archaeon]|nr:NDP-sugar synthase [archaeon]